MAQVSMTHQSSKHKGQSQFHRKDHHILEPSQHRAEKPQIAQIHTDSIAKDIA